MITIKKVKKTEHSIMQRLISFWKNHPFISVTLFTIFCLGTAASLFLTLTLAAIGGGYFEMGVREQHDAGKTSDEAYEIIEIIINVVIGCFNYLSYIMIVLVVIPVSLIIYKLYKWKLQRDHDIL